MKESDEKILREAAAALVNRSESQDIKKHSEILGLINSKNIHDRAFGKRQLTRFLEVAEFQLSLEEQRLRLILKDRSFKR